MVGHHRRPLEWCFGGGARGSPACEWRHRRSVGSTAVAARWPAGLDPLYRRTEISWQRTVNCEAPRIRHPSGKCSESAMSRDADHGPAAATGGKGEEPFLSPVVCKSSLSNAHLSLLRRVQLKIGSRTTTLGDECVIYSYLQRFKTARVLFSRGFVSNEAHSSGSGAAEGYC
nr:hypothetical protein CFP56_13314 [Quercus suber]